MADRAQRVQQHRGDVSTTCASVVREELRSAIDEDDEDDSLQDIEFLLWLEQAVADEVRRREAMAIAMYEEQEALEQEELAALLATHLAVETPRSGGDLLDGHCDGDADLTR